MTIQSNTTTSISNQVKIKSATIGEESVNSVDARELHSFLGSKQEFANWVKLKVIENPFFQENQDFILLDNSVKQTGRGGHNRKDYALTQDTAKKVSMAEQTARGNEARDYFLLMEKQAKSLPIPSDKKEQLDIGYVALGHLKNHLKMSDVSYLGCAKKLHCEI